MSLLMDSAGEYSMFAVFLFTSWLCVCVLDCSIAVSAGCRREIPKVAQLCVVNERE
jgi:hypothetical protein